MRSTHHQCLLGLALLVACSADKPASRAPELAPPVRAAAPSTPTPEPLPLGERLRREASEHPEARERVERELAQLQGAGVVVTRTRQALAQPLAARYCATALTETGLGLSLCAFADAEQAARGRERSRRSFDALIPGRSLLLRENVLLTYTQPASDAARAEAERVRQRFTGEVGSERAAL